MLTPILKERMMRAGLTGRPLLLGLGSEIDEQGRFHSCPDAAYEPQPVVFGDPYQDGADVKIDNVEDVLFAAWATDSPVEMRYFVVTDTEGIVLAADKLERTTQPLRGDSMRFWPGDLTVSLFDPPEA